MPVPVSFPGVFIEEISPGARTIPGVPTSVAAFIGSAKKGTINRPVRVISFADFGQHFGPLVANLQLGYAVAQFFANGGTEAIVVRIARQPSSAKILAGIRALDAVESFNLLALPGITIPAIIASATDYCRQRRAFLIVDPPANIRTPAGMEVFIESHVLPQSPDAAIYFPWTTVSDRLNNGHPRSIPPSGTIAGLIARIDSTLGVWKSPAGPHATLVGVKSFDHPLTDAESTPLNSVAVNCLRTFPTFGNVAWGARTLAGGDAIASEWKYIAIRRLALFIEESIHRGTQWAIFEPNAEPLWLQIRSSVEAFLQRLLQQGALAGNTPPQAFFVKCGPQTMTAADITAGIVNIQIGFAPLRPAEFILLTVQHRAGQ